MTSAKNLPLFLGATLDSGIGVARYAAAPEVETTMNYSNKSPLGEWWRVISRYDPGGTHMPLLQ